MLRKRDYVILIAVLISVLAAVYLTFTEVRSLRSTLSAIEDEKNAIESLNDKAVYLQEIKNKEQDYATVLEEYNRMIPSKPGKNDIIGTMYELGKNCSVDITEIKFDAEVKGQRLMNLPFTINLNGDYIDIFSFFEGIRQQKRIYNIININLTRESSTSDNVYANILLNSYYVK